MLLPGRPRPSPDAQPPPRDFLRADGRLQGRETHGPEARGSCNPANVLFTACPCSGDTVPFEQHSWRET